MVSNAVFAFQDKDFVRADLVLILIFLSYSAYVFITSPCADLNVPSGHVFAHLVDRVSRI